jgi:hypothetical protein
VGTSDARQAKASRIDFLFVNGSALLFAAVIGAVVWALQAT